MSTYILSGLAAGITGVVMTSQLGIAKSDLGGNFTMMIITACVLGGTLSTGGKGSVIGTTLAAVAITLEPWTLRRSFRRRRPGRRSCTGIEAALRVFSLSCFHTSIQRHRG